MTRVRSLADVLRGSGLFVSVLTTSIHSALAVWAALCVVSECFCSEVQLNLPRPNNGCL